MRWRSSLSEQRSLLSPKRRGTFNVDGRRHARRLSEPRRTVPLSLNWLARATAGMHFLWQYVQGVVTLRYRYDCSVPRKAGERRCTRTHGVSWKTLICTQVIAGEVCMARYGVGINASIPARDLVGLSTEATSVCKAQYSVRVVDALPSKILHACMHGTPAQDASTIDYLTLLLPLRSALGKNPQGRATSKKKGKRKRKKVFVPAPSYHLSTGISRRPCRSRVSLDGIIPTV